MLGVSINVQSSIGLTALHLAALDGQSRTIGLLLKKGADASLADWYSLFSIQNLL
jgi:ankyrin repeat protein